MPCRERRGALFSLKASLRLDAFPAASWTATATFAVSVLLVESALRRLAAFFLDGLSVTLVGNLAARLTRRAANRMTWQT